jgi:predicted nucleic acid-binding protein
LRRLIEHGRAAIVGPVRQEVLSGIRDRAAVERLRDLLRAFPDEPIDAADYERAAECYNLCRAQGLQGSNTHFLLCAVAERHHRQAPVERAADAGAPAAHPLMLR